MEEERAAELPEDWRVVVLPEVWRAVVVPEDWRTVLLPEAERAAVEVVPAVLRTVEPLVVAERPAEVAVEAAERPVVLLAVLRTVEPVVAERLTPVALLRVVRTVELAEDALLRVEVPRYCVLDLPVLPPRPSVPRSRVVALLP